jgi:hypothetical protein
MGLFNGTASSSFKSDKPFVEVLKLVQDSFENVGPVDISDKGLISIDAKRYSGFSQDASISGTIREKDNKYYVDMSYEARMTTVAWVLVIIGLFCFGAGILVLLFPILSKNDMKKKVEKALDDIRFESK